MDFIKKAYELAITENEKPARVIHAAMIFEAIASIRPAKGIVWLLLGNAKIALGRNSEALHALEMARKFLHADQLEMTLLYMGEVYGKYLMWDKAEDCYQVAEGIKGKYKQSIAHARGANFAKAGKFDLAIKFYQKALEFGDSQSPSEIEVEDISCEIKQNLGLALRAKRKYQEADQAFKESLALDLECELAQSGLEGLKGLSATFDAINSYKSKKNAQSQDSEDKLNNLLSLAEKEYSQKSREVHVIELLELYLDSKPNHAEAWNIYGDSLRVLGLSQSGYEALKKGLGLADNKELRVDILDNIAFLCASYRTHSEAEEFYKMAIDEEIDCELLWVSRGKNFLAMDKYPKALECFEEALDLAADPEEKVEALFEMGKVLRGEERFDEAEAAFEEALRLDSSYEEARIALGGLSGIDETLKLCQQLRDLPKD